MVWHAQPVHSRGDEDLKDDNRLSINPTSRAEAISLGLINTTNEAHELRACITMKVWRPERVF